MKLKFTGIQDEAFRKKIQTYHAEYMLLIKQWVVKPLIRKSIEVQISDRMKSNAGWACYGNTQIKLNYWLLSQSDTALRTTYGHELAHLITHNLYSRNGSRPGHHGPEWKFVMKSLGLKPARCHQYQRNELTAIKAEYRCRQSPQPRLSS